MLLVKLGDNNFLVDSLNSENQYLVDMNSGMCQCSKVINGSPCKHQYDLCVKKVPDSLHFIPRFSPELNMTFSDLAVGCSMDVGKS